MANQRKTLGTSLENRIVLKAGEHGLKAHRQPGSGVFKDHPHDAVVEDILVEAKVRSTPKDAPEKGVRIDFAWLSRVRADARKAGFREGIVVVNQKGSTSPMVLCTLDFLLSLLQKEISS